MGRTLSTEKAYLWWAIGIALGAVIKAFLKGFPYAEFGGLWTFGFLGVSAKRLIQKHEKFTNGDYVISRAKDR